MVIAIVVVGVVVVVVLLFSVVVVWAVFGRQFQSLLGACISNITILLSLEPFKKFLVALEK